MSSDESDKTVFKPAIGGAAGGSPDQTSMRPMPGGRGHGAAPQQGQQPRPAAAPPRGQTQSMPAINTESAEFHVMRGLNPLVNAASSLIGVFEKTHGSLSHPNIGGLHQRLTSEIRNFENRLRELGFAPEIALSARYVMCSILDEAVLNTPWGSESPWGQKTLLSVFHNESSGGEKFFLILDRMKQAPADNLHMIELMYVCLSLGFEGKYRLSDRGHEAVEQIRDELFATIRRYRGDYERSLSDSWKGLGRSHNTLAHYVPMWVIVVVAVSLLFFSFSGFRWWLYKTSTPVANELSEISSVAYEELRGEEKEKDNKSTLLKESGNDAE
ncbi:MAG: type IVB secretion system protein IcmH/DotU [Agarilytica sp.]